MESLVTFVNRIERACSVLGEQGEAILHPILESLPTIAVVGSQSSGKSSVLGSFVGRDFLPRGSGIVTRRPLVLQLHKIQEGLQDHAEFLHLPNTRFTDFSMVRKEIEDETAKLTQTSNQISPVPIHLSIYSPNEGQPESIVQDIESMILSYIEKPNCIILAITRANQDIAKSAALKISRKADPNCVQNVFPSGLRTFGVLTKLDLTDRRTNALDVVEGISCRLLHPWVGIVNCSQADINSNVDMIAARQRERDFFKTSPDYQHLASKMGSEYLARNLSMSLKMVIRVRIPEILSFIDRSIHELHAELSCLGTTVPSDAGARELAQLLEEDSVLTARRQRCAERLKLYRSAWDEIDEVSWSG